MFYLLVSLLINICLTVFVFYIKKISKLNYISMQIIVGLVFSVFGILSSVFGSIYNGAIINIRDSYSITASFIFGGPSGLITGFISGIFRFLISNAADYTRVACSIATILAGLIAYFAKHFFFQNKIPSVNYSIVFVLLIESIHLLLVFATHLDDLEGAYDVVMKVIFPLYICNGLSVVLAIYVYNFLYFNKLNDKIKQNIKNNITKEKTIISKTLVYFCTNLITVSFILLGICIFQIQTYQQKDVVHDEMTSLLYFIKNSLCDSEDVCKNKIHLNYKNINHDIHNTFNYYNLFLVNHNDNLIYTPLYGLQDLNNYSSLHNLPFLNEYRTKESFELYDSYFTTEKIYYTYTTFGNYSLIITVDKSYVMFSRNLSILLSGLFITVIFSVLFIIIYIMFQKTIIAKIVKKFEQLENFHSCKVRNVVNSTFFTPIIYDLNDLLQVLYKKSLAMSMQLKNNIVLTKNYKYLSEHDSLTNVYNRYGFENNKSKIMQENLKIAFVFIDIDNFKTINDTYGHDIGDKIILKISNYLKNIKSHNDILMRFGGDEFAMVHFCSDGNEERMMKAQIDKINSDLLHPVDDLPCVSISVGAAFSDDGYNRKVQLEADQALYKAKTEGRCRICFFK